ncbi:MAG: glycosyltransferase family 39 protein, partial [Methanobrevibacter sp.]|nr:glycosyltransferase family 39 protein [Methanobrevibacter sp.]
MISKIASKDFLKKNSYLIFLIIFSVTITTLSIYNNMVQEILGHSYRDIYFYLIEALRFSGVEIGGYSYVNHLSPLIPFLTSLLFRLGFVSEVSIFFVSGIFYIIGVLGVYFLLKLRFNKILSTFGAILFGGLSVTLIWTANGTIDIPSTALSIFALYFMILGVYKNQNYFYLAFPIFS